MEYIYASGSICFRYNLNFKPLTSFCKPFRAIPKWCSTSPQHIYQGLVISWSFTIGATIKAGTLNLHNQIHVAIYFGSFFYLMANKFLYLVLSPFARVGRSIPPMVLTSSSNWLLPVWSIPRTFILIDRI